MITAIPTLSLFLSLSAAGAELDGKDVFLKKKCNVCHSVKSADVAALQKGGGSIEITDLSGLSLKRKAEWLAPYLERKEKLNDKPHPTKFKGEAAELEALVKWLQSLKPAA